MSKYSTVYNMPVSIQKNIPGVNRGISFSLSFLDMACKKPDKNIDDQHKDGYSNSKKILFEGNADPDPCRHEDGRSRRKKPDLMFFFNLEDCSCTDKTDAYNDGLDDPRGIAPDKIAQPGFDKMIDYDFSEKDQEGYGAGNDHVGADTRRLIEPFAFPSDDSAQNGRKQNMPEHDHLFLESHV